NQGFGFRSWLRRSGEFGNWRCLFQLRLDSCSPTEVCGFATKGFSLFAAHDLHRRHNRYNRRNRRQFSREAVSGTMPARLRPNIGRMTSMATATATKPGKPAIKLTKLLINNEWVDPVEGGTFDTYNPATGEVIAKVAAAGPKDVDLAVKCAR